MTATSTVKLKYFRYAWMLP